jgi:hypothetical protein
MISRISRIMCNLADLGWYLSLGFLCATSVSSVVIFSGTVNHRDTEDREVAQRRKVNLRHHPDLVNAITVIL